jgi:hypothetical protein
MRRRAPLFISVVELFNITLDLEKAPEPKSLKMKQIFQPLSFMLMIAMASSCSTPIQMQKTYPPEAVLPVELRKFAFVNFYDYRIPEFIKNKHEGAYGAAVNGYAAGLGELVLKDPGASFLIADTLRDGFTVMSMQLPEFTDTVRAICREHDAGLLVALDSIRLWVESDISLAEDDEGDAVLAKDFYLFSNTYITLYNAEGEVIDRCAGEKSTYVKSKYTIFGMIGGPTLSSRHGLIRSLSEASARDCLGRFYPFTENYTELLYTGGSLKETTNSVIAGRPEEALEPLREMASSASTGLAIKAAHNLDIVNRILEERKVTEEVWNSFVNREK